MSASIAPTAASIPTLAESGYRGFPCHHMDLNLAPVMFIWWAKTPTGRQSKFWRTQCFHRLRMGGQLKKHNGYLLPVVIPTEHHRRTTRELYEWLKARGTHGCCPPLPKGYEWQGPFLYSELPAPTQEGPSGPNWFAFKKPERSDGIPLGYVVDLRTTEAARQMAARLLGDKISAPGAALGRQ